MNRLTIRRAIGPAMMALLLISVVLDAQNSQTFAEAQRQNAQLLRQYTWKSRTEIQKGRETKSVQLMLMRYDTRGSLQTTLLSGTSPEMPERGLRGRIARKKKEAMLQTLEHLKALASSYGELPPADMQRLMASAVAAPEDGAQSGLIRASGTNLLQRGDAMNVWADAATRRLRKVEILSSFEKNSVRVVLEYQDLPDGPTIMVRSVLQYPSGEITLITENFEYVKLRS